MIRQLLTYGFLLFASLSLGHTANFVKGNEYYESGDYEKAIESYSSVIAQGVHSAELYYNLGNAHYRNGEIGKAIWAYESALKIDPDHEDALYNLEFANAQTVEKLDTSRLGFGHWLHSLLFSSNINFWAWMSIICAIIFSFFGILFIKSKSRSSRNLSLISSTLFTLGLIFSLAVGYFHKDYLHSGNDGVIVTRQVNVLMAPIEDAGISYKLGEGARVELVSEEKEWIQINLNGNKGWVQKKDIWEI